VVVLEAEKFTRGRKSEKELKKANGLSLSCVIASAIISTL
jgi:hypothetical protein